MSASKYTPELGAAICARLATGDSLRVICADEDMPGKSTVLEWVHRHPDFKEAYDEAFVRRVEAFAEEIVEIADDGSNDWMEKNKADDAGWVANGENIQRSRLRIDSRKWLLSKLISKRFGDKLDLNHSGKVEGGAPVDISKFPVAVRDAMIKALEAELAGDEAEGA